MKSEDKKLIAALMVFYGTCAISGVLIGLTGKQALRQFQYKEAMTLLRRAAKILNDPSKQIPIEARLKANDILNRLRASGHIDF